MEIISRSEGNVTIVGLAGPLEFGDAARLAERFRGFLRDGRRWFVFDLRELPYVDSTMIAETVACLKRARERSGDIKVVALPNSKVSQILDITSLYRVLDVFESVDEAVKGCG